MSHDPEYVLTLSCPDTTGIVFHVSGFLFERACNIIDSAQFGDESTGLFFLRVDHAMTPERLAAIGHDVESMVLARAVKWHIEQRVLVNGRRTVVFR